MKAAPTQVQSANPVPIQQLRQLLHIGDLAAPADIALIAPQFELKETLCVCGIESQRLQFFQGGHGVDFYQDFVGIEQTVGGGSKEMSSLLIIIIQLDSVFGHLSSNLPKHPLGSC